MLSKKLQTQFKDYSSFHKTHGNQLTHFLGIPLIVVGLLGLLARVKLYETGSEFFPVDLGLILITLALGRYLWLDWKITLPFSGVLLGCYFVGRALPPIVLWAIFVLGWVFQGAGHAFYEKKSPAFVKNLEHLLIGPLWIFAKVIGAVEGR